MRIVPQLLGAAITAALLSTSQPGKQASEMYLSLATRQTALSRSDANTPRACI